MGNPRSITTEQALLITCEHATNTIPRAYARFFQHRRIVSGPWGRKRIGALLHDHWGYDPGALATARYLQRALSVPLISFLYSRLFIEIDSHRKSSLFSPILAGLSRSEQEQLRSTYWASYARTIDDVIRTQHRRGKRVVHIASHSFTPVLRGVERRCDVGVLFDPKRPAEARFAHALHRELWQSLPGYRVRKNYPYAGVSEGLVTYFRRRYPDRWYIGVEIEVNNRHIRRPTGAGRAIRAALARALRTAIASGSPWR